MLNTWSVEIEINPPKHYQLYIDNRNIIVLTPKVQDKTFGVGIFQYTFRWTKTNYNLLDRILINHLKHFQNWFYMYIIQKSTIKKYLKIISYKHFSMLESGDEKCG